MTAFLLLLAVILMLGLTWWLLSFFSAKNWEGNIQFTLQAPASEVFALLTDLERLPERRKEIDKVEILQPTEKGQVHWREIASMGGFAEYEVMRSITDKHWDIKMLRSSFGMKGCWKYAFRDLGEQCQLTIEEDSQSEKFWIRGLMQLAGRNATLRQEKRHLQKAFSKAKN